MTEGSIFESIIAAKAAGKPVMLATIIRDQGSVPRHAGSKMLVYSDGKIEGTVGGGQMESLVIDAAARLLKTGKTELLHYDLVDPSQGDPGVCGGQVDIFMEPIMPDPTVLVIGCGHVGQAVADLANWLGFRVIVTDDREDLCNAEVIPKADEYIISSPEDIAKHIPIHERTYIAALTRGVPLDLMMLPSLLESPAPYIGVIGSRRRWATTVKELQEQHDIDDQLLARVRAPIGLNIEAETPREIAVSVMAEIIAHHYGGDGESLAENK